MLGRAHSSCCLVIVALLAGCTRPVPQTALGEYLDDSTGTTVMHLAEPVVYFRDAPMLAAHARDYVSLAPLELSQGGQRRYLLWVCRWSTIDRGPVAVEAEPEIVLIVDDEPMELAASRSPSLGHEPYAPPVNGGELSFYLLTRNQVERLAAARQTAVYVDAGAAAGEYLPWKDASAGLSAFARRVEARGRQSSTLARFDD